MTPAELITRSSPRPASCGRRTGRPSRPRSRRARPAGPPRRRVPTGRPPGPDAPRRRRTRRRPPAERLTWPPPPSPSVAARGITVRVDHRPRAPARLPRARPALRRVRPLRPRRPRVRPDPLGRRAGRTTSRSPSSWSTPATPRSRSSRWARTPGSRRSCATSSAPRRLRRGAAGEPAGAGGLLPGGARAPDGPDVGRPGLVPALPGRRRPPPAGGDRRPQPPLPARLHGLAAAVRDRRGRLLRHPRRRPPRRRRRGRTSSRPRRASASWAT